MSRPDHPPAASQPLRVVRDFAGRADAAAVDLLLFPECFLQGYLVTEEHLGGYALDFDSLGFSAVLSQLAGLRQMLVFGVIERAGGRYYNAAVVVADGRLVGKPACGWPPLMSPANVTARTSAWARRASSIPRASLSARSRPARPAWPLPASARRPVEYGDSRAGPRSGHRFMSMTSTIELERLVRASDLQSRRSRHRRPGRRRGWFLALTAATAVAAITAVTAAITA